MKTAIKKVEEYNKALSKEERKAKRIHPSVLRTLKIIFETGTVSPIEITTKRRQPTSLVIIRDHIRRLEEGGFIKVVQSTV